MNQNTDPFINYIFYPYIIDSYIGKGTFGLVYKVHHIVKNTLHAVKIYTNAILNDHPPMYKYLENQIAIMTNKYHKNITNLEYSTVIPEIGVFLVMEFCDSGNLKQLIRSRKTLDEGRALEILSQLVDGFKYLYFLGLMHRDFKSQNVLITTEKSGKTQKIRYKIADFDFIRLGTGNTYLGTVAYMAPEVLENGDKEINKQVYENKIDIWSLGVVFYEMLYGVLPFKSKKPLVQLDEIKRFGGNMKLEGNVSEISKDFLRKSLVVNKFDRIGWNDIFEHPATRRRYGALEIEKKEANGPEINQIDDNEQNGGMMMPQKFEEKKKNESIVRKERKWWHFLCMEGN